MGVFKEDRELESGSGTWTQRKGEGVLVEPKSQIP